jgi:hypothetical protein
VSLRARLAVGFGLIGVVFASVLINWNRVERVLPLEMNAPVATYTPEPPPSPPPPTATPVDSAYAPIVFDTASTPTATLGVEPTYTPQSPPTPLPPPGTPASSLAVGPATTTFTPRPTEPAGPTATLWLNAPHNSYVQPVMKQEATPAPTDMPGTPTRVPTEEPG